MFLFAAKLNSARNVLSYKPGDCVLNENLGYCCFPLAAGRQPRWSFRYANIASGAYRLCS